MQTLQAPRKRLVFAALLATFSTNAISSPAPETAPLTLADLDAEQDFSELEHLVSKLAGPHCSSIEFHDDNRKHGCRSLEWIVCTPVYNGYSDRNEDGVYADTSPLREIIWVPVEAHHTIQNIAERVAYEVQCIDDNRFA
ncbi:hypothetical protein [Spirosoma agri]|uniref:Uncharacterized protein n=1 Tax=Spirosoma agri TaxID=1987381 RepID=A0A6M0IKB7_9BACT|nr:hypothetical protein [Spirosoma agri]NEU68272.1 hypothetical protein [Spirosoma agri]